MVPGNGAGEVPSCHFPRIRGDGPPGEAYSISSVQFSPYSRGWSVTIFADNEVVPIFPVFAGMVRLTTVPLNPSCHFPRIRGDGPGSAGISALGAPFSPYSRGWSRSGLGLHGLRLIFPVFAGMVRVYDTGGILPPDFPRIRGDGPP